MSQEIEEIKKILLKYNPTIKERLDASLVDSKSIYALEESLNEIVKKEAINLETRDIVLICDQLQKLEKKKYRMLSNKKIKLESER